MKTITLKIPTTEEARRVAQSVRNSTRSARGSFANQLQRFAKKVEPKPAEEKK